MEWNKQLKNTTKWNKLKYDTRTWTAKQSSLEEKSNVGGEKQDRTKQGNEHLLCLILIISSKRQQDNPNN